MSEIETWNYVKCLDFVRYEGNVLTEIMCKLCGTSIAGMTTQLYKKVTDKNGNIKEIYHQRFQRHHNFAELKIEFTNGSFHVTTICTKCLSNTLEIDALKEIYWADVLVEPSAFTEIDRKRVPVGIAASLKGAGGLM